MYEATKGKYSDCRLHFSWKENEKRLEKHSGSNSKSHRSAVKGQPSWQQRYGGTMVNHSHASPNNTRQGGWLRNTDSPICLLVHTVCAPTLMHTHWQTNTHHPYSVITICIALLSYARVSSLQIWEKIKRGGRPSSQVGKYLLLCWCLNAPTLMMLYKSLSLCSHTHNFAMCKVNITNIFNPKQDGLFNLTM